jgi:hypothetical protein
VESLLDLKEIARLYAEKGRSRKRGRYLGTIFSNILYVLSSIIVTVDI